MSEVQATMGLLFIAVGALFCFAGWPLYKVTVAITGFLIGGAIGAFVGDYLVSQSSGYGSSTEMTVLLIALITAVVAAWLAVKLINVVAFLFGFAYFAVGTGMVMEMQRVDQDTILVLAVVMGIVGGILAVVALRFSVTLSTAITGALLITLGAQQFNLVSTDEIALVMILALAVLGFIVQYGVKISPETSQAPAAGQTPPADATKSSPTPGPPAQLPGPAPFSASDAAVGPGSAKAGVALPMESSPAPDVEGAGEERFCSDCGVQLHQTATRFCNQCGAPLP